MQEIEFTSMALLYLLARYRQYNSFDEMLDRAFFMGKALVLLMLYMTDTAVALRWAVVAARECKLLLELPKLWHIIRLCLLCSVLLSHQEAGVFGRCRVPPPHGRRLGL